MRVSLLKSHRTTGYNSVKYLARSETDRHVSQAIFFLMNQNSTKTISRATHHQVMQSNFKEKIAEQILLRYGFKEMTWISQLGGLSTLNYELRADSIPFILKKYRSNKEQDIARIERVTHFLYTHQMPVIPSLLSKMQEHHFTLDGNIFALFPKIEGKILHEPSLSNDHLLAIASLLAKLHRLNASGLNLEPLASRILPQEKIEENAKQVLSLIQEKSLGAKVDQLTQKLIQIKLETVKHHLRTDLFKSYTSYQHLVHGDFHNENMLFNASKKIILLLDFEEAHYGHRIEDVVHFILLACCNTGYAEYNLQKAQFFMHAYAGLFPLTPEEIMFGVHYGLFREFSSFFIEKALYQTRDLFFVKLIERDIKKALYFRSHIDHFITKLNS